MSEETLQGSKEWLQSRCGKLGASKVHEAIARTKSGWGASRANLMASLVVERLTGVPQESYKSEAMMWGTQTEPQARDAYSFLKNTTIEQTGFVLHPTIDDTGASPDGMIGEEGLLEIKCPNSSTHLETLLGEPIDKKYITQMMWQLSCTGRKWVDFMSFDPRFPVELQSKIIRVDRDEELIRSLQNDVVVFLGEVETKVSTLRTLMEAA